MDTQYFAFYAGTSTDNMTLICSSEYNPGILSPSIKKEVNTAGSLEFTILPDHPYYNSIQRYLTIVDVYLRNTIVFRGRVFTISKDFYKQAKISCEGNLSWFIDNYLPKSSEVLENVKPFTSVVKKKLAEFNASMEEYKHFATGIMEPPNQVGNMIDSDTVVDGFVFSSSDGNTQVETHNGVLETGYLDYEDGTTYNLYVGEYEDSGSTSNGFFLYNSSYSYLGRISGGVLNTSKITAARITVANVAYFRVAGVYPSSTPGSDTDTPNKVLVNSGSWYIRQKPSSKSTALAVAHGGDTFPYVSTTNNSWYEIMYGEKHAYISRKGTTVQYVQVVEPTEEETEEEVIKDLFWVTTVDETIDPDEDNTWAGGNWGDYLVAWINDAQHVMMRARVVNGKNVLDILNPRRAVTPVSEIVFADNLIDLQSESEEIEAYSYIYPIFEGVAYPNEFPPVEIPNAVAMYGKIYKEIDFGQKPTTTSKRKLYNTRMQQLLSLYDPTIVERYRIKALDKKLIFDNYDFSIIDVCDVVRVKSTKHIGQIVYLLCLSVSLDVFNPENNEYEIGQYIDDGEDARIKALTASFAKKR